MKITVWDHTIFDLLHGMQEFSKESTYNVWMGKNILEDIWKVFNDPMSAFFLVYTDDGLLAGWAFCQIDDLFMDQKFGYTNKFYILPEYRGTGAGRKLAQECTDWFDQEGATYSFTTATAGVGQNKQYINLMGKFGYEPTGTILHRGRHEQI